MKLRKLESDVVPLPVSLVAEGILGDRHVVLIPVRLVPVHGHHLGIVAALVEGLKLALTFATLGMSLTAHAAGAADQLHARTVLRPFGLQGLPGDADRCSPGGYVKSTEIRHFSICCFYGEHVYL